MPKLDKDGNEIVEENFVMDEAAVATIVKSTKEAVMPEIQESLTEAVAEAVKEKDATTQKEITDAAVKAATDLLDEHLKVVDEKLKERKNLKGAGLDADSFIAKGLELGKFGKEVTEMSAPMRFYRAMRALEDENLSELKKLNRYAVASQLDARAKLLADKGEAAVSKTGYANETTAADGAVLIPDADFITTVHDNLPKYGVAFQYADVRQTDRTSVRVLSLDAGLSFFSTAEAGVKTGAKLAFAKTEQSLGKYAVIVPSTDELSDDAAVDYWNLVTRELARAYAKKADELVFTDTSVGITNVSGVLTQTVGTNDGVITWDDIFSAEAKTEDDLDESNFKWFMRKQSWIKLVQTRADAAAAGDAAGGYLIGSLNWGVGFQANLRQPTTPWGTEVVFTRVLPTVATVSANDGFAVYGDLSNTMLFNKRGMALKMLTEATVVDSEGSNLNLATQDASAMRGVVRMLHITPKANRPKFVVLGTGTVS